MGLLSEMGCNLRNEGNKKYINQKPARNSRQIGNVVGMSCYCLINLNINFFQLYVYVIPNAYKYCSQYALFV